MSESIDLSRSSALCHALGDLARFRLYSLLEEGELSVSELCAISGLSQSRVSSHLAVLLRAGLVEKRLAGRQSFFARQRLTGPTAAVVEGLTDGVRDPLLDEDRARRRARTERSAAWPATVAGEMERHYSPGRTWESVAKGLVGCCQLGRVLDLGAGDGFLAALLAPRAKHVTAVELDPDVARAARARLDDLEHVEVRQADVHRLPFKDAQFDLALIMNALCAFEDPQLAIREAARVLRPGGGLVVVTLAAHAQTQLAARYGQRHLGFLEGALAQMLKDADFEIDLCARSTRERRPPHFEVLTAHARKAS